MKLIFHLNETMFDCVLHIRDASGTRAYRMTANAVVSNELAGGTVADCISVNVTGDFCEVTALPKCIDQIKEEMRQFKGDTFFETLGMKLLGKLADAVYRNLFLHVAVTYRIPLRERLGRDVCGSDAVHLHLTERFYGSTAEWASEIFDLYPVTYTYFELGEGDVPLHPVEARGLNTAAAVRFARKIILTQCAGWGLILYPFFMSRTKRLTRDRVLRRKLKKLYRLPPEKRAKKLETDTSEEEPVIGRL